MNVGLLRAGLVLAHPEWFSADDWYEAMALVLAERSPA